MWRCRARAGTGNKNIVGCGIEGQNRAKVTIFLLQDKQSRRERSMLYVSCLQSIISHTNSCYFSKRRPYTLIMASSSAQKILHRPLLGSEVNHTEEAEEGYDCPTDVYNEQGENLCFGKEARDAFLCWFLLPAFFFSQIALVYFLHENDVDALYWPLVYFDVFVFLATAWLCRCSIIIDDGLQGMDIFWLFLPEILTDLTTLLVLFDRFNLAFVSLTATIVVFAILAVQALIRTFCARFSNDGPEEYTSLDPAEEAREIVNLLII